MTEIALFRTMEPNSEWKTSFSAISFLIRILLNLYVTKGKELYLSAESSSAEALIGDTVI